MGSMLLLALDTSLAACSVALWRDGTVAAERCTPMARGHAEALAPMIQALCRDADLDLASVDAFAVTLGPGTFTGIRVGLAAARGLALPGRRPLVGVSTLAAIAASADLPAGDPVLVVQDAKRGELYAELMGGDGPRLLAWDALEAAYPARPVRLVGSGAQTAADRLRGATVAIGEVLPRAAAVARLAAARLVAEGAESFRVPPSPLYLRAPDAKLPAR